MSGPRSSHDPDGLQAVSAGVRDRLLVAVLVLTATAGEACADGRQTLAPAKADGEADAQPPSSIRVTRIAGPTLALGADLYSVPPDIGLARLYGNEFTPRKRTLFDPDPRATLYADTPMLRGTTMWQRMADYRGRNGVRLLTLWEAGGGCVSLQAGKHGDPSLQWTSTTLNRGGATRGLLDKLFAVSIAGAEQTLRSMTHTAAHGTGIGNRGPVTAGVAGLDK